MPLPAVSKRVALVALIAVFLACIGLMVYFKPPPAPSPATFALMAEAPPQANVATPEAQPKDKATTVLELFNPSDKALTKQLNETNLSQQIEHLMATSFVLTNCGLISADDYKNTYHAAIIYAQKTKLAPNQKAATLKVRQITDSAGASYALIYRKTKCDDPKLAAITQQLKTWQEAYLPKETNPARLEPD